MFKNKKAQKMLSVKHNVKPAVEKKIKVLWYSDFLCNSGFGRVAESILSRLYKTGKYEFKVLAINHGGDPYNDKSSGYYHLKDIPIYPACDPRNPRGDLFGKEKLANMISKEDFDVLFVLQDTFNLVPLNDLIRQSRKEKDKSFKYVFYFPCDGSFKELWVTNGIATADYPVVYTNYGKGEIKKLAPELAEETQVIYHGYDPNRFTPITEMDRQTFRKEFFKCDSDTIIVTNVNRNQPRKDLPRTIDAFMKFNKLHPNSKLYLHCFAKDPYGFALDDYLRKHFTIQERANIVFPNGETMKKGGYPESFMNHLYGSSDMVISTTLGEGWGLSATEALACEVPIVIPDNTSAREIVGDNEERGYLVECGKEHIIMANDNEHRRPLTDINSLVEKMCLVAENPKQAKEKAIRGRKWLEQFNWDNIAEKFDTIFTGAYDKLMEERKLAELEKLETTDDAIRKQDEKFNKEPEEKDEE